MSRWAEVWYGKIPVFPTQLWDYIRYINHRLIWDTFLLRFLRLCGRRTESRTVPYARQEYLSLDRYIAGGF